MVFGKYKGRLIAGSPGHYLIHRGELGRLLARMHESDHSGLRGLLEPLRKRAWRQSGAIDTARHFDPL